MGEHKARHNMVKKVAKKAAAKVEFPANMIEKKPRTFSIGGDIRPSGDLTRFVKWPKYIRIQRARRIWYHRIKIPPAINQFKQTFDKRAASQLFRLLNQLKPETKAQKTERIGDTASTKAAGGQACRDCPRRRPNRDCHVAAIPVQGSWHPLLHRQIQGSSWRPRWQEDRHLPCCH